MSLKITVQPKELWDEEKEQFISLEKATDLVLEHSLVSISKWEAKWKKPYLTNDKKSTEEILDYIRCMTITQNVDPNVYYALSADNLEAIREYIEDDMTATTFSDGATAQKTYKREVITSEVIYYIMTANNIPVEFQKWHLNRLLVLLKVCGIKNAPPKKMSKRDTVSHYAALNKARRAKHNSRG